MQASQTHHTSHITHPTHKLGSLQHLARNHQLQAIHAERTIVYLTLLFVPLLRIMPQLLDSTVNALFQLVSRCLHNPLHTVVANKVKVAHGISHIEKRNQVPVNFYHIWG